MTEGHEEEETLEANGEEEPMWLMPDSKGCSIASPVEKKNTMPRTILSIKEKEEWGLKLISSTLTRKRTHYMKEAKLKEAE
jgi:hypothetical protein